jgi:DNA-binding MarR family transcriptional regulator
MAAKRKARKGNGTADFPPFESAGHLVRDAHRMFQQVLERRIAPYGVTRGQWYFLRALWVEDGLSQRELSNRVGMMEPTTVIALQSMEKAGLVRRERSVKDKRKAHVWLTPKAQKLKHTLLPVARLITMQSRGGVTKREFTRFRDTIKRMTENLERLED